MKDSSKDKIIAVIPAHNEEKYIEDVVTKAKKYVSQVIVVDDASKDKTGELAKKAGAVVLRHIVNLYKGAALKTGCEAAINLGATKIVMLDGDGQHDPEEIPVLLSKLNKADIVFGYRVFNKNMPITSRVGNKILSFLINLIYHTYIKDTQSGYKAFNAKIYPKISWGSNNYGVETEIIKNMSKNNIPYNQVKIKTIYFENYKGTSPVDGLKILLNIFKK